MSYTRTTTRVFSHSLGAVIDVTTHVYGEGEYSVEVERIDSGERTLTKLKGLNARQRAEKVIVNITGKEV